MSLALGQHLSFWDVVIVKNMFTNIQLLLLSWAVLPMTLLVNCYLCSQLFPVDGNQPGNGLRACDTGRPLWN